MLNTIFTFFKDNTYMSVTFIMSLISLSLSVYNWWYDFRHTKAKINVIFKECKFIGNVSGSPLSFHLIIENLSHLDVSISQMLLNIDEELYEFDSLPYHILKYESSEETKIHYSCGLPVTIPGLGACGDFFCIKLDEHENFAINSLFSKKVSIIVKTNRKFEGEFSINLNTKNTHVKSSATSYGS